MIWMTIILFLPAFLHQTQAYQDKLGFIYKINQIDIPTTTYTIGSSFEYKLSRTHQYDNHLITMNELAKLLKTNLFKLTNDSVKIPAIGISIAKKIKVAKKNIKKLISMFKTNLQINSDSIDLENITTLDGKIEILSIISLQIYITEQSKTIPTKQDQEKDTFKALVNFIISLDHAIAQYNREIEEIIYLIEDIRNFKLTISSREYLTKLLPKKESLTQEYLDLDITGLEVKGEQLYFLITTTFGTNYERINVYKSIPMFGYVINQTLYSKDTSNTLFTLACNDKYCIPNELDKCAQSLTSENLYEISKSCPFVETTLSFEATEVGLFIYKKPQKDLQTFLDEKNIALSSFPCLITFSGCLNLTVNKHLINTCYSSETKVIVSQLNLEGILGYINPTIIMIVLNSFYNYPLIITISIVSTTVISLSCILHFIWKKIFCCHTSPPPPRVNIIKKTVPRNRAYQPIRVINRSNIRRN